MLSFAIEELHESHGGAHMAKVLHEILIEYNLTDKVRFFFHFLIIFCTKYLFFSSSFLKLCTITANNASNNSTMVEKLEKLLKGSNSRFTKNYLAPSMTHVLNLAVQHGLKSSVMMSHIQIVRITTNI